MPTTAPSPPREALVGPAPLEPAAAQAFPPEVRPIVVMDEIARARDIYGDVFERLGVAPIHAFGKTTEEILGYRPAAILLSSEWTHEWRLTAAAARQAEIPVIYVIDGVLEWSYVWNNLSFIRPWGTLLQPLIGSDLCVIGRHQARILASMGLGSRLHVVGLPRLDRASRERIVSHGDKPRIVVATPRTAAHNVEQQAMALRALRDLRAWFAGQTEIDVVWRIAADLAEDIGVAPDIHGSMCDVLARATALISFTSTCVLEGMLKGLPVAQVDYRPMPSYVASAWEIRCADHIPNVVQELLYPPPPKLAWQDACFCDELEAGGATDRLAAVIRDAMARPTPYAAEGDPQPARVHGRLDYRQIHSELSAFAVSPSAVLQYELAAAYGTLRHTKHEKGILQRECIELSEAFAGCDIRQLRTYSFLDRIAEAKSSIRPPGNAAVTFCSMDSRASRVLALNAPAELTFAVPAGSAGKLSLAIGMHPDVWTNPQSGPCRFIVKADAQVMLDSTIDTLQDSGDRKWWWFELAVPDSGNGAHTFTFATEGVGGDDFRWALWRNPTFLWVEPSAPEGGTDGFMPRMAAGFDFYVPNRTLV